MFVCTECGDSQPQAGYCAADRAPLAPVGDDLLLGTTVGVYRIARLIGLGGMGRVYKGVHPTIGSRVAIKVLSRESSDRRDLVERFFSEAKAVNLIRHESIVDVLDLSRLPDGRPYLVMEFLDGSSLSAIIEQAKRSGMPLPIGGIARLCVEVLDGLRAAHGKGIIHRDLKPDNIYVSTSGRPKILDFGIAKLQPEHGGSSTHAGSLLGTPHYMSPEQASAQPLDLRADLYAIGVILFECMTLCRPFAAAALFDLLRMHIEEPPPSPRSMRPDLPEGVEHVILAALAKRPDQRFSSAQAMSMALQNATSSLPPQQWAAIQPAGASRAPVHGGWAPTPPSSWAGGAHDRAAPGSAGSSATGTQPSRTARAANDPHATMATYGGAPHAGMQTQASIQSPMPPPMQPAAPPRVQPSIPMVGHDAHMPAPRASSSRKPLWIGLGALILVGGGITVAVVNSGSPAGGSLAGSSTPQPGSAAMAAGSDAGGALRAAATTDGSDPWGTDPGTAAGGEPGSTVASDAAVPEPVTAEIETAGDVMSLGDIQKQMNAAYAEMFANLPPEMRPPELKAAMTKYGTWAKIPGAEQRKLMILVQQRGLMMSMDAMQQASDALSAQIPTTIAKGPDGWLEGGPLNVPWRHDVRRIDTPKMYSWAVAEAKKIASDAKLLRYDATGVFPDGHADLTVADPGVITYKFISPARVKRDASRPVGAKQEQRCAFSIIVERTNGVQAVPGYGECDLKPIALPRCTLAQVWTKALAKNAPKNGVASLNYYAPDNDGKPKWFFSIEDNAKNVHVGEWLPDDC